MPSDLEVLNCENLVILENPSYLKVPGYMMAIFGAQTIAVFHLRPQSNRNDGYRLIGTQSLLSEGQADGSKVTVAKLVIAEAMKGNKNEA